MKKEQLLNIKRLLELLNKKVPEKRKNSLILASSINTTNILFCIYSLIETDIELQIIIKSLLASGVTTGFIIFLLVEYLKLDNEKEDKNKIKVLKK